MKFRKRLTVTISILLHVFLILAAYIFQGAVFPFIRLGGFVPLLLPVTVTGVALYEGQNAGGIYGLFAGILCDISFNQPIGTFTVVLTVLGLCVGILSDRYILSSLASYYIICTAVLIICAFVQMTPIVAVQNTIPTGIIFATVIAQTVYTLVMALPIWFFVRALGRRAERITPSGRIL